jgi:TDG/mug DNA glycosylase family protein
VIFVGTAAGKESTAKGQYYAGPGNRFWPALHQVGLTPTLFDPSEFQQLLDLGIGLTDLSKLGAGMDHEILKRHFDVTRFNTSLSSYRPGAVAFTSKKTGSLALGKPTRKLRYGRQLATCGSPEMFVLPSPSGAARGYWNLEPWQELSNWVRNSI